MTKPYQERMHQELKSKEIFDQAQSYGYEYMDDIFDRHVFPTDQSIEDLSVFDEDLSDHPTSATDILKQLHTSGSPATIASQGGRYFGFVTGSAVPIGVAAKNLGSFWDQSPTLHVMSPITSKLEDVVEKWLIDLLGLPASTCAGFVSGTSAANICGLAAARYRVLEKCGWDVQKKGLNGAPKIRLITGRHTHSAIMKAVGILGLGHDNIEWVDVDNQGRIKADEIPQLDEKSILILQAGNVTSGSFDDFKAICQKAKDVGAWIHVDGAFGLWAAAVEKLKHLTDGMQLATSWALDGHKTLNTPYDSGVILCADKEALSSALNASGSYIVKSEYRDGMFYTPEMSKRSRIIEFWAIMKYLGKSGLDDMIYNMHERALQFAEEISSIDGFIVENDVVFNQVIVRCESDEKTQHTLKNVQELRDCWAGGATWFGNQVIRVSVCSWATTADDISRAVSSFKKAHS